MKKLTEKQKASNKAKREKAKRMLEIVAEKTQKQVDTITLSIEWKKSRMWGNNPTLTATVIYKDGGYDSATFKASGYGYCKASTVISQAFNAFLCYKLWAKSLKRCERKDHTWKVDKGAPYGIYANKNHRSFAGGIGTNYYFAISEFINGKFEHIASGNSYDTYKYTDKSRVKKDNIR